MSFFSWGRSGRESQEHSGRNLQDGLFQIASQACHILVQVNNTQNVSYGGNNTVTNVAYSKYTTSDDGNTHGACTSTSPPRSSSTATSSTSKSFTTRANPTTPKDQDVVVLLPHRKSRTPRLKHKLSVRVESDCIKSFSIEIDAKFYRQRTCEMEQAR
ncbi:hypothetical protein PV327_003479 [Microctonus hyperodae]|uniref:Uncharacterized protein n=1 Tax=Microctonus hyperodae TaxID=165561 RepID=A0AA39G4G2_MICHY|nr:hypothetical protein PV327_003479 [Microctonus hyperodae]